MCGNPIDIINCLSIQYDTTLIRWSEDDPLKAFAAICMSQDILDRFDF